MRKVMFIVSLLVMALLMALPTFAQDSTVFCGTLAAADCDLLKAAQATMANLESGTVDINGQFILQGVPDTPDMTIGVGGKATYSVDKATIDALTEKFKGMDQTNVDVQALVTDLLDLLKAFDGTLVLDVTLPAELATQAGMAGDTITFDMAFVDGVAYFNFDKVDAATGGMLATQGLKGIGGVDMIAVATAAMEQDSSFVDQLQSMMNTMMANPAMMDSANSAQEMQFVANYATIERTDGGSGEAVFVTTVDLAGVFADPEFATYMQKQMEQQGNTMTDQQLQQTMGMLQLLGKDITLNVEEHVDTASQNVTYVSFNLAFDPATLFQMMGTPATGDAEISLKLDFTYSGFNATTVTAPAGAELADPAMVVQMLAGSTGVQR